MLLLKGRAGARDAGAVPGLLDRLQPHGARGVAADGRGAAAGREAGLGAHEEGRRPATRPDVDPMSAEFLGDLVSKRLKHRAFSGVFIDFGLKNRVRHGFWVEIKGCRGGWEPLQPRAQQLVDEVALTVAENKLGELEAVVAADMWGPWVENPRSSSRFSGRNASFRPVFGPRWLPGTCLWPSNCSTSSPSCVSLAARRLRAWR